MTTILIILQVFIVCCLIVVVLVQKTSSDTLAGLSGGGHNVLSSKSTSNFFSKATVVLGIAFMLNSLMIAKFHVSAIKTRTSISDNIEIENKKSAPQPQTPEAPAVAE